MTVEQAASLINANIEKGTAGTSLFFACAFSNIQHWRTLYEISLIPSARPLG
ncbi:hypothetical protein [Polaromonas sp.]|uniref:hypothetical protein n=1 Tax=Polaromonas sp. TaxID=1869339 RepID=UPI001A303909|nr:hypothetical protein [Comamonadaceae bacterium]